MHSTSKLKNGGGLVHFAVLQMRLVQLILFYLLTYVCFIYCNFALHSGSKLPISHLHSLFYINVGIFLEMNNLGYSTVEIYAKRPNPK